MKSDDDDDQSNHFGGKVQKLTRKRVMRRKNAVRRIQIHEELAAVNNLYPQFQFPPDNFHRMNHPPGCNEDISDDYYNDQVDPTGQLKFSSILQIVFTTNPSYHRIYSTLKQTLLYQHFTNQFVAANTTNAASLSNNRQQTGNNHNNLLVNSTNPLTNSFDHFLIEDEFKFGQLCSTKNIPKVISMGLNVVLDIIKDTYEQNPKICIRSLESLYNLLQGLKPESLKNEPPYMIEKYFELIQSMITLSYSSIGRTYTNSFPLYENYHSQILELSLLSLITFSVARGDTSKILNCIKILAIECNVNRQHYNFSDSQSSSFFEIEIPEILILLNKHVCSFLLGKHSTPEWYTLGFPVQSLCETFQIKYIYHQRNLNNVLFSYKSKSQCPTSLTFDGQNLILYRCNRIFLIGSGYNNTTQGHEIYSFSIDISNLKTNQNEINSNKCCLGGWIGYVNGDLFLQPHSNWSSNQIIQLDPRSLKFRNIVPLLTDYQSNNEEENPFSKPTLCTTDGDCLILITVIQDDYFIIRELKPLKINFEMTNLTSNGDKEKITFSLSSEFTIRLSSVCFSFCGQSIHNLNIPSQYDQQQQNKQSTAEKRKSPFVVQSELKLIETNSYCDLKNVSTVMSGKDFALMLTDQGKVYYTGNSHSLGIRHLYSYDKWSLLNIPKPVKIVQLAIGHEGNHVLMLADDGTVFFVGTAKRGEDGESSSRSSSCRFNKPSRVKKFTKIDSSSIPCYIACNHGTSTIVTKSGDLYLFGKDSQHANSKGLVTGLPKDFQVKSIALGKAHMLILSTKGLVVSSGFSNKGQCGFNHNSFHLSTMSQESSYISKQVNDLKSSNDTLKTSLDSRLQLSGHTFTYGKSRRCVRCYNCTENGTKCPLMNVDDVQREFCICGYGNSGCSNCGICAVCSQTFTICTGKNDDLNMSSSEEKISSKSVWNARIGNLDLESDYDCPSKMTSIPPTLLPLSQLNPIIQIAAGLHHSVLLSEKGEVFTFGSNQFGQLGVGDLQNRFSPTRVQIDHVAKGFITQIAAGANHTILLTSMGELLSFGNNQNGQLGRSCYNLCNLNTYMWNTFPDRMDNIGPEYGRLASQISASGDFTFIKYDEILLSSNMFTQTKLMAERNNLILVPPVQQQMQPQQKDNSKIPKVMKIDHENDDVNDEDVHHETSLKQDIDRQKTCRHIFCCQQNDQLKNNTNSNHQQSRIFNNLSTNILVISRINGTCSILKQSNDNTNLEQMYQQINFVPYSSMFIDKFYHNFWAYNSSLDQFSRYNLISLEMFQKVNQVFLDKTMTANYKMIPTSMLNLYKINNNFNNGDNLNSGQFMKFVPSIIQPDISIPLSDNCLLRKKPEQLALELFSSLTSLTYSHLLGLSVNDKMDQMNYLAKNLSPEEYLSVCRFEDYGGGWGYPPHSVEAIRFSTDCDIILGGVGLYGGRGEYNVQIRLFDIGFDGSEMEKDGDLLSETDLIHYECLPRQKYQIFFDEPLLIQANRWYIIWASINGPSSDCGSNGQAFVCTSDQVMFHFKPSKLSNNGTDVNSGQIPTLFYKQLKSTEFLYPYNNNPLNISSLIMDEEGLPFSISKDFILKINSSCIDSLCEILRFVWNSLKTTLLHPSKLDEIFSCFDEEKLLEKLDDLILKIRRNLYLSCFSFELIRAYVQIFLPIEENSNKKTTLNSNYQYNQIQKFLHYDYDEYKKIANSLFEVCSLLTMILMNPIQIQSYLEERLNNQHKQHRKLLRPRLILMNRLQNFFLDECYQTYLICCNSFYPTYSLKWSLLCDLLTTANSSSDSSNSTTMEITPIFSNKQLYLLSAVGRSYCQSSVRLISFFPILRGSLNESFANFENLSDLKKPDRDVSDLASQMISKRLAEFHPYGDYYLCKDYTCSFVYGKLLNILIEPLRLCIENFQTNSPNKISNQQPTNQQQTLNNGEHCRNYRQFHNAPIDNGHCDLSSSLSSTSSSSSSSTTTTVTYEDNDDGNVNNKSLNETTTINENLSTLPNDSWSWDTNFSPTINDPSIMLLQNNKNIYESKLISSICDLLLKFISEFFACSLGLINTESNGDSRQNMFPIQNEYVTPSRFYRRSSTKCWETGAGSPEAICFWINKPGIYISGVRVYASTLSQFKYQLQLLDQAFDDCKTEKSNFKWKTIASVSGIYSNEDNTQNKLNDLCELRFERPIHIHPNIKYAILFKNHSQYSYSGDMGLAQVRGDDDTVFTFMDCSLSKNGTNLNRGQIPQLLYYNIPSISTPGQQHGETGTSIFDSDIAKRSIVSMFNKAIKVAKEILSSVIDVITQIIDNEANRHHHSSESLESSSDSKHQTSSSLTFCSNVKILLLLYKTFDSMFFRQYLPFFMIHFKNLKFNPNLSHDLAKSIAELIPLISTLNQMIHDHFEQMTTGGSKNHLPTETSHQIVVESDHPYKPASVTSYLIKFPQQVHFMTIEFDQKSCTAQPEDYLDIYIPYEHIKNLNMTNFVDLHNQCQKSDHKESTFKKLIPIYQRFSGKNFEKNLANIQRLNANYQMKQSSNCIFVPGNEIVFMLKTSSDYVHSADLLSRSDSYYGFKVEIIGYEFQTMANLNDMEMMKNLNKDMVLLYVNHMIEMFECDLVNLFGSCVNSLMNSSPSDVFQEILNDIDKEHSFERKKLKSILKHFDAELDVELSKEIYQENHSILHKSLHLDVPLNIKNINELYFNQANVHSFLDDFIKLNIQTSGARLALWLQNEAFILPNSCLMNVINDRIDCCQRCCQFLLEPTGNHGNNTHRLCSRCHYQFFVKALASNNKNNGHSFNGNENCINTNVGKKMFIIIVTRDQHEEIAHDQNACVEVQIRLISFFSNDVHQQMLLDSKFKSENPNINTTTSSPILQLISNNPYQMTVKDKTRYHSITMMKAFENYCFEELRLEMHSLFNKKTFVEPIMVRSFNNGYYLACWTPISTGSYRIELMVDGEKSENTYLINVNNTNNCIDYKSDSMPSDKINYNRLKLDNENLFATQQSLTKSSSTARVSSSLSRPLKHSIRKFICPDSAGLRIRALPSLQSEQIGIVAVNGLLTIIDQLENDDGIWVRLSNESIQAYSSCNTTTELCYQSTANKDLFTIDNFETNLLIQDLTGNIVGHNTNTAVANNMKQSFTFTLRTEAWALQHNKHFNRTLLVAIDSEDDINSDYGHQFTYDQQQQSNFIESLIVPGWFQVVICGNDGHLIRNWPSLDEESIIIGIIPLNEIVYAVEIIQNEFGVWIRLSQDSLHSYISVVCKSSTFDSNIEGWMLVKSVNNGIVYLRNIQQNYLSSTLVDNKDQHESNNNNKYDDLQLPTKSAISNRAAQCIRAVFASFVWHEDILNDVLTAASYLKFNAEITKDFVKMKDFYYKQNSIKNSFKEQEEKSDRKKLPDRRQVVAFRHSVEVSQLMKMFQSSDVNSNVNFLENNNNDNVQNNNNNENNNDQQTEMEQQRNIQQENVDVDNLIPEILINLLQIWDFISSECLKIFGYFNNRTTKQQNKTMDSSLSLLRQNSFGTSNNNNELEKQKCVQCEFESSGNNQTTIQPLFAMSSFPQLIPIQESTTKSIKEKDSEHKIKVSGSDKIWRKHVHIDNMQQLYDAIFSSVHFLLSLVPSNHSSTSNDWSKCSMDQALFFDKFLVTDSNQCFSFQLLQHLGIKKSFYEEKLAEEKLSDLAILSLQQEEDHQHLLSPDFYDSSVRWRTGIFDRREIDYQTSTKNQQVQQQQHRKPFKFHRSISVGMNDPSNVKHKNILFYKIIQNSSNLSKKKHIKSNETLSDYNQCISTQKFNVQPFLCKPSSRLISLIQKYVHRKPTDVIEANIVDQTSLQHSPLMCSDVFKFIFSCYNIELYSVLVKSAICSSAYRSLALNILNWLLLNVSSPTSVHDIMWNFVYSLLPLEPSNENILMANDDENLDSKIKNESSKRNANVKDVCQHPFKDLIMAGDMAEKWVAEALYRFMKSIANLLPLLPMGSPLQRMAIRCFGIEFNSNDHIFLHECKVFSHISTILTRSSTEDCAFLMEKFPQITYRDSTISTTKDLTMLFEMKASSRQSMIASLVDNSTETFWESGNEDRNKIKHIIINRCSDSLKTLKNYDCKFVCIYVDNTRDIEYRVSHITWKICSNKIDSIKYPNLNNVFTTFNECEKIKSTEVDSKFCGWIQCELSSQQNNDLIHTDKYLRIELNGQFQCLRIRQIKILAIDKMMDSENIFSTINYHQAQTSNCETETLRVFRLLTSQVFGKLLSNDPSSNNMEKRSSIYLNNNENNLREHMVGILFSQYGKLTELQKQVCTHIVNEIHYESNRVQEEWQMMLSSLSANDVSIDGLDSVNNYKNHLTTSKDEDVIPSDSYCFELLSLVLALSGSIVGREYLAQQKELLYDILTLLHTSSDRVKRQVLSLIRRVMPSIQPFTFAQLLGIKDLPTFSDVFAKTHNFNENINRFGMLDIFLSCIAKSLTVQFKIKGLHMKSREQSTYTMEKIFLNKKFGDNIPDNDNDDVGHRQKWWLKGIISKKIAQSIIMLIKDMISEQFGKEWSELSRICIIENVLKLTQLDEQSRLPDQCIQMPSIWLALASLCVLDEKDADLLSSNNLSKYHHDQVNRNSSQLYCDNHDDGQTIAFIQCNVCGHLCADCDRFLHLNTKTRSHKRHIFKDEIDSIKVDIHEGCGRVKFFWSIFVADSKLLKAMIEFRNNLINKSNDQQPDKIADIEQNSSSINQGTCRFCGMDESITDNVNVCQNEECQRYSLEACNRILNCGHYCSGIVYESPCLPCLHGCSRELKQDGDDMCMICFSESLFSAPCIQLVCNHVFHYVCVRAVLEKRWSGGRITFTFSLCPICKIPIDHPSLSTLLEPIRLLYKDVQRKALMRLEYEGLNQCEAITTPNARFYQDALGFAMERYSYYLCFKCQKAYYGGEARCDADYDGNNFNAEELICGSCSDVTQAQICSKHGTDFLEYKCRFCCSVAVYFCFGSTHFCNACHDDFQRLVSLKEYPQCPVGPHCVPLDGGECPLHVVHPPTGQEFALGCGICRNAHTF